jgi:hypothetical protein
MEQFFLRKLPTTFHIEPFFFAPANKRLALAPDLIGIYFGFFFFLERRKRKSKPNKEQTTLRTVQKLPLKKSKKGQN